MLNIEKVERKNKAIKSGTKSKIQDKCNSRYQKETRNTLDTYNIIQTLCWWWLIWP